MSTAPGPAATPGRDLRPARRYILPERLRPELATPWGPVVTTRGLPDAIGTATVLAVGDVVSMTLLDLGITPKVLLVDYRTQRRPDDPEYRRRLEQVGDREVRVANPAATITREAWDAVVRALAADGTTRIVVDGEEDLLGIPCFLEAPAATVVVYGVPGRGVAVVRVDDEVKALVAGIVQRMDED